MCLAEIARRRQSRAARAGSCIVDGVLPDKTTLCAELLAQLRDELDQLERAHREALEGATHEEAKPENSKDTRALEQSYLARGQAQRVAELRRAVAEVAGMTVGAAVEGAPVGLGALVTIAEDEGRRAIFVAPHGGGSALAGGRVSVVTPHSLLGRALMGRRVGDEGELVIAGRERVFEVIEVA